MPYIDPTGVNSGWSDCEQPGLGLTEFVDTLPTPPTPVPQSVSAYQAFAALQQTGMLTAVQALFSDSTVDPLLKLAFDKATSFQSDSPTLVWAVAKLGWTAAQVDQLFTLAATFQA